MNISVNRLVVGVIAFGYAQEHTEKNVSLLTSLYCNLLYCIVYCISG